MCQHVLLGLAKPTKGWQQRGAIMPTYQVDGDYIIRIWMSCEALFDNNG
jgi:hypothetical protein